jgi:hypothetical protein
MDLQQQLEIGKQAEDFLKYTTENLYFRELIERIKLTYAQAILSLNSGQKDEFSSYRSKMEAVEDILNAVSGDIYLGAEAFKQINEPADLMKGGIL